MKISNSDDFLFSLFIVHFLQAYFSGCLPLFSYKTSEIWVESRRAFFSESPLGNCGLPPEVLHFFCLEWNDGDFLAIGRVLQFQSPIHRKQL